MTWDEFAQQLSYHGGVPRNAVKMLVGQLRHLRDDVEALKGRCSALEAVSRNKAPHLAHIETRVDQNAAYYGAKYVPAAGRAAEVA